MARNFVCNICERTFAAKGAHLTSYEHRMRLRHLQENPVNANALPLPTSLVVDHSSEDPQEQHHYVEQGEDESLAEEELLAAEELLTSSEESERETDYYDYGVCAFPSVYVYPGICSRSCAARIIA